MAQFSVNTARMRVRGDLTTEERRYVRRLLETVDECKKGDPSHESQLAEISRRLRALERCMSKVDEVTELLLDRVERSSQKLSRDLTDVEQEIKQLFQ